jgi:hypothetical protein
VQGSRAPTPFQPSAAPQPPAAAPAAPEALESGWDSAPKIASSAVIPAADEVAPPKPPPVGAVTAPIGSLAPIVPVAVPPRVGSAADQEPYARRARSEPEFELVAPAAAEPTATQAAPSIEGLPPALQEQLFGVLHAALNASLLPLLQKQQELEARLEWLNRAEERALAAASTAAHQAAPAAMQARGRAAQFEASVTPAAAPAVSFVPSVTPEPTKSVAPTASIAPTSYGFVITPDGPPPRPAIEVALENVGPIDVPDFGSGRRRAGRLLVALMLAGVVGAILATILSYT